MTRAGRDELAEGLCSTGSGAYPSRPSRLNVRSGSDAGEPDRDDRRPRYPISPAGPHPHGRGGQRAGDAAAFPLRRDAAVGGELAGQACPLLKIGEQFSGHLDPGGEELAEQLGRKHPLGLGGRGPWRYGPFVPLA